MAAPPIIAIALLRPSGAVQIPAALCTPHPLRCALPRPEWGSAEVLRQLPDSGLRTPRRLGRQSPTARVRTHRHAVHCPAPVGQCRGSSDDYLTAGSGPLAGWVGSHPPPGSAPTATLCTAPPQWGSAEVLRQTTHHRLDEAERLFGAQRSEGRTSPSAGRPAAGESGLEPLHLPGHGVVEAARSDPGEPEPVVQPVGPPTPELDALTAQPVAAPEVGDGHVVRPAMVGPALGIRGVGRLQGLARVDGFGLA